MITSSLYKTLSITKISTLYRYYIVKYCTTSSAPTSAPFFAVFFPRTGTQWYSRPVARGVRGVQLNPPFDHKHVYIIQVYIHTYIYMSIRANQVPTQGSAETVSLHSNSKITLLATRTAPILPLGTHFFRSFSVVNLMGVDKKSGCGRENFCMCLRTHKIEPHTQILAMGLYST